MHVRKRRGTVGAAVLALLAIAGCASTTAPDAAAPPPDSGSVEAAAGRSTHEYRAGVEAEVYLPEGAPPGPVPVVVTVPGGSWATADRTRLAPLAEALASEGILVVNASYRAMTDHVLYPVPVQDVACAVSFAAQQAVGSGYSPEPLVVVGHSAGAHLAALAALAPEEFAGDCPAPPVAPTGLVGLAGPYDLVAVERFAESLLGAPRSDAADLWTSADPVRRAGARPELDVLLVHGDADRTVPPALSRDFATVLRDGGHDVTLSLLPDVDHMGVVVAAGVTGPVITRWIDERTPPTAGSAT
jgi:acetyl esterase/lipase